MSKDYYLDKVDVQNGAKTLTAACVPDSYQAGAKADLIVFLHGTNQTSAQAYLSQSEHNLRAELDSAKPVKNVVLIVPTLTTEARGGNLGGDGADSGPSNALKSYLSTVWTELQKQSPSPAIADFSDPGKVNKIVLAAHSGGGKVMLALARTKGTGDNYADKIAECWGFDCVYGQPTGHVLSNPGVAPDVKASQKEWTAWETKYSAHREMLWADWLRGNAVEFFLYCATGPKGGGTTTRSTNLDKLSKRRSLSNVHITFDGAATHDGLVRPRFAERLNALTL